VLILAAVLLLLLFGLTGLALDWGYVSVVQADLQATADSAALAGVSGLVYSQNEARNRAIEYASKNIVDGAPVVLLPGDVEIGLWNAVTHAFTPVGPSEDAHAVKVTAYRTQGRGSAVGLFFARAIGFQTANVDTTAVAVFGSRDIITVQDLSGSMNDDSMLGTSRLSIDKVRQNLQQIYHELGDPNYGTMQYDPNYIPPTYSDSAIVNMLGLNGVTYPYPQGGWTSYVRYIKTDSSIRQAGYRDRYGYMTLANYWLSISPKQPDPNHRWNLWQTSEQPITAVKDALMIFLDYMRQVTTDDRVRLVTYTYTNGRGFLEVPLTTTFGLIETTFRQRQAGHYFDYTNIGAGIQTARNELSTHGRAGAFQMIVLLSDGKANWTDHGYDLSAATRLALDQARVAGQEHTPILTISLGADADDDLMQQIAELSGGVWFDVPGGDDVSDYEGQLMSVFAQIAAHRPLRLVD
jgi:hypothetical protein